MGARLLILATLIKGYKSYDKSIFVPISKTVEEKFSVYIGNNGVGKSAILESLDTYFNGRVWNLTRGATKDEVFIVPIFLIEKNKFNRRALNENHYEHADLSENSDLLDILNSLSNYFWNVKKEFNSLSSKWQHISNFFNLREELRKYYSSDDYYLFLLGVQFTSKESYFSAFNDDVKKYFANDVGLNNEKELFKKFDKIKKIVTDYYSYVYFPVEQSIEEILKIEARQMQTLMNKDVLEEIDKALSDRFEINGKERNFITFLNNHLNEFIKEINQSIQQINSSYNYGAELFVKKNLTASDIREKILEAFFLKRSLKYNNKEINQLSSGEQRRALIDIAYSFLSNEGSRDKEIILAIDEPEVSMSISNCFSQFTRLEELANTYDNQILLTTHWYGSLPTISKGYLHHIQEEDGTAKIRQFNFFNYLEEKKNFPDDIDLKSMFDLASSILSHMKTSKKSNWIICEGSDDKVYIESIIKNTDYIRVLPVGGMGNVVKLYNLLSNPISSEKKEFNNVKESGKILCIIDTDNQRLNFNGSDRDSLVQLRRLQLISNETKVKLIDPARQGEQYSRTVIEDCLDPKTYYESIKEVIEKNGDSNLKYLFNQFSFNEVSPFSSVTGYDSIIKPKDMAIYDRKSDIEAYLSRSEVKFLVAKTYSEISDKKGNIIHKLEEEIMGYFDTLLEIV